MKKLKNYPLVIIFFLSCFVMFVLYIVKPDKEMSVWENRYLSKRPVFSFSALTKGDFTKEFEDYTKDQLPFRDGLIKCKAYSETALLKVENNGIVKGKDSYLFKKDTKDVKTYEKNISIVSKFVDSLGDRKVDLCLIPNAVSILSDKKVKGMPCVDQKEYIEAFNEKFEKIENVTVTNAYESLYNSKDEYIYYRTDHHYTTLGAYRVYESLIKDLKGDAEAVFDLSEYTKESAGDFLGTNYAKYKGAFVTPDVITFYDIPIDSYEVEGEKYDSLYDTSKLSEFDKYGVFLRGNFSDSVIVSKDENAEGSIIIFKDSYANSLIPFLTKNYKKIIVVDLRYLKGKTEDILSENKDSDILLIYNFDFFNEDNHFYKLIS